MDIKKALVPESGKLKIDENGFMTAIVLDADYDAFMVEFIEPGRMEITCSDMEYITLGKEELRQLSKLLREADKEHERQFETGEFDDFDIFKNHEE
jgi:hypothetical protein